MYWIFPLFRKEKCMITVDEIFSLYLVETDRINEEFDIALCKFAEELYEGNVSESVSEPFGSSVKKFFANLITAIRNYINKLKNYITKTGRELSYTAKLSEMEKSIRKAKEEGKTKVTMLNYDLIRSEYENMCADFRKYGRKFVKMKYTSTLDIDRDLNEFESLAEKWDKRMEKVCNEKKTMSIDEALKFVENEKRGYTHVFDSLNESIQQIDEISHVAEETSRRVGTLGSDIIPKHVGLLKKIANTISNKVTKFASKTIAINVLLFA